MRWAIGATLPPLALPTVAGERLTLPDGRPFVLYLLRGFG
jgi:hypothetical protein